MAAARTETRERRDSGRDPNEVRRLNPVAGSGLRGIALHFGCNDAIEALRAMAIRDGRSHRFKRGQIANAYCLC